MTTTAGNPMKPRSRDVTDGLEKAAARGMLRAVGMGDDDFAKPQIGVASSWNEITPCNLVAGPAGQGASRRACSPAGGYPLEFGTISVSDGISMGHEGMHFSLVSREVIADCVETVMQAERLDGVGAAGRLRQVAARHADGRRPARPGRRCSSTPVDPRLAGPSCRRHRDDVTIIDAFEAVGACARGLMTARGRRRASSGRSAPARAPAAACTPPTRWPAPPRRSACRCPARAAPPAADRRRDGFARRSRARPSSALLRARHHRPRHPDQGGVRERDRRRDGARRLDQRGAAPAGHRARGRGRPDARRLQPHRRPRCRTWPTSSRSAAT